jgi:hypothetical protein
VVRRVSTGDARITQQQTPRCKTYRGDRVRLYGTHRRPQTCPQGHKATPCPPPEFLADLDTHHHRMQNGRQKRPKRPINPWIFRKFDSRRCVFRHQPHAQCKHNPNAVPAMVTAAPHAKEAQMRQRCIALHLRPRYRCSRCFAGRCSAAPPPPPPQPIAALASACTRDARGQHRRRGERVGERGLNRAGAPCSEPFYDLLRSAGPHPR